MSERTVNVPLTLRELVLIRVALMERLDKLTKSKERYSGLLSAHDKVELDGIEKSYDESRVLCAEKLWDATKAARKQEFDRG